MQNACFSWMPEEIKQPSWIEQASAILDKAEEGLPVPSWFMGEEFPVWVGNVFGAVLKASMPGIAWKDPKRWTPGDLGAFLGGKTVYWVVEEKYDPSCLLKLSRDLKKEGDRRGTAIAIKYFRTLWMVGLPQFREALNQCFALVVDAPHHEKIRFFRS
jgi:hypothetical protein